jgi:hypothetical protein
MIHREWTKKEKAYRIMKEGMRELNPSEKMGS